MTVPVRGRPGGRGPADGSASSVPDDFRGLALPILSNVNPRDQLRSAGKRLTEPVEPLAQRIAERVVDLLVNAVDVNALVARVDLNAVLARVDVDDVLAKVDVNALLDR